MPNPITSYFEMSQLSLASYTNFSPLFGDPPIIPSATAVRDAILGDFPFPLANQFAGVTDSLQGFRVLSQSDPDDPSGFSATLFQRTVIVNGTPTVEKILAIRGTEPTQVADILTDINVGLLGNPQFSNQYESLKTYIRQLRTDPNLLQGQNFSVSGHSLGGWLGAALSTETEFKDQIQQVYTYNAPGFNGGFGTLLGLVGVAGVPVVDNGKVTNFIAQGPTLIAGAGQLIGPRLDLFIENDGALHDHSIVTLTDALAVYDLFGRIAPSAELSLLTNILKTASNVDTDSLEQSVAALHQLFLNQPATFAADEPARRIDLYERLFVVRGDVAARQSLGVTFALTDLTNPVLGAPAIAGTADTDTDQGLAYRYALKELNPFAVVANTSQANDALYQAHNDQGQLIRVDTINGTGALTTQYLDDRALFLKEKIALNQLDQDKSSGNIHFKDFTPNGLEITTTPSLRADREFLFGSDDIDTLTGGSKDDHHYGGGSVDVLIGNAGRDYLEGGGGSDRLEGGAGADTMVGGSGNDTYLVDDLGDQVIEVGDNGNDSVESSVNFSLAETTVEKLTLTGTNDLNGTGNDLNNDLTGNDGINRLEGKGGTDHLIGGIGNDVLAGGIGNNDLLEGGAGFDTYIYNAGDGTDRIEDSDASGQIIFNGGRLLGGIHDPNDPLNTYKSLDGLTTYVLSGTDLIVNGVLTVNENFQSGQFGIQLDDLSDYPTNTGVPTGPFQRVYIGTGDSDFMGNGVGAGENGAYYGLGGNDEIIADSIGDNLQDGGADDDILEGRSGGNEYLDGGTGNDYVTAFVSFDLDHTTFYDGIIDGNDILLGGTGDDVLVVIGTLPVGVAPDPDYLDGGEGTDYLRGEVGADRLLGGDGDDTLRGDNLPDGWPSLFLTVDHIWIHVPGEADFSATGGADFLDGGIGNDLLVGDGGDDILSGGADDDQLFGDDEAGYLVVPGDDMLDGGAGDDLLAGGDGADSLSGGTGIDQLFGDKGIDILDGGDEADTLHGGDGADELFGGAGADQLFGDGLNTPVTLSTAGGADFIDGGAGNDHLEGGIADDTLFGGTENDVLFGDEGADCLLGDEGDDELQGGEGNDLLSGDAGDDRLFGQADNDTLYGGEGNDQLAGNDGTDTLVGGAGNDVLEGGHGNDVLVGGAGQDAYNFSLGDGQDTITDRALAGEGNVIQFFGGITLGSLAFIQDQAQQTLTIQVAGGDSIRLLGFDPNTFNYVVDTLSFADGTQVALADQLPLPGGLIEGTDDRNVIRTGAADDTIFAAAGNDVVFAGAGNDVLIGGGGNDFLAGGTGQDQYVFNAGDGTDTISDSAGEGNRIVFGTGMTSSAITLGQGTGNVLEIRGQLPGDRLEVGALVPGASPIETFQFADGTVLTFDQFVARGIDIVGLPGPHTITGTGFIDRIMAGDGDDVVRAGDGNDVLNGEAGNDSLEGEAGDDVLVGGTGDDQLFGGAGNDTYRFNLGDGLDSISDSIDVGEPNRVLFGAGFTASSVTLTTNFGQIVVRPGAVVEGVMIGANGSDALGFHAVDNFEFADGTVLTYSDFVARGFDIDGTEFDDFLFGTNVIDRFRGGLGNDRMEGGEGNDSYFFNLGDGVDTIVDTVLPGAGNEVVFGPGVISSDLRLDLASDQSDSNLKDLLIHVGTNGDAVQLDTFDRSNVFGPRTVETFRFADGSTLTYDQLLARGFDLTGTAGDDQLDGTNVTDRMVGGDGTDVLRSGLGDDTLDGGAGNDMLIGGQGNDTYLFGPGSGQDTILEFQGTADTIRMAAGVVPTDVVVTRNNNDLVLSLNGGTDRLTVSLYFLASPLQIEQVLFADGTVWDHAFIENLTRPAITGTGGNDVLVGTGAADQLLGLAGNDQLTGLAGDDLLDGGTGVDTLTGGIGDDTYVIDAAGDAVIEALNGGIDTVQSSVSATLATNVENLILTGNAPIDGTGNALDNVLMGNSVANVFTGGTGNDTYVVGVGDTVVESTGEGIDTVQSEIAYVLGANLENLTLIGNRAINGAGNDLDNVMMGNGAPNVFTGGRGNDTYVVETGDTVIELAGEGIDTIETTSSYSLGANLERLVVRDTGPSVNVDGLSLTGNELDNVLTGNRYANVLDGGLGADVLVGGGGDDRYIVDNAGDTVVEGINGGTDTVFSTVDFTLGANVEILDLSVGLAQAGTGNELDNSLYGNDSDNILDGGAGNDILVGGAGQDTYLFGHGSGRDTVVDGVIGEVDTILMAPDVSPSDVVVTNQFFVSSFVVRIVSTGDEITINQQTIAVKFADGTVWDGDSLALQAGAYPRTIQSGDALDNTLFGGIGDDEIGGNLGDDHLFGEAGNDRLQGGDGGDFLSGGLGDDHLYGESFFFNGVPLEANDTLLGDAGDDYLSGDYGDDVLDGGTGDDTLAGGDGSDRLNGGPGNDFLDGGANSDVYLFGRGSGHDMAFVTDGDVIRFTSDVAPSDVTVTRDNIVIQLRINGMQDQISTYLDPDDPSLRIGQVEFANGTIWSQATLFQKALSIVGTDGPDFLGGTRLQETFSGGPGDDTYDRFELQDTIIEAIGGGIDTVVGLDGVVLPANVENLTLFEDGTLTGGARRGTGNAQDNILTGNTADNVLDGGDGNDTLIGGYNIVFEDGNNSGDGSDILIGGAGDDFLQSSGNLLLVDFETPPRFGQDLLIGGSGNDTYMLSYASESIIEGFDEGTDTVIAGISYTLGDNLENLTLAGVGDVDGTGNALSNLLIGNSVNNVLSGGVGDDTLWGGSGLNPEGVLTSGDDMLLGGAGNDTYLFNLGDGIDTIQDVAAVGEGNRIQFGVGITQANLTFTQDSAARTLTIQVGSSGTDKLLLTNFDPTNVNGSLVVTTLAFVDGSTVQLADLLGGGPIVGTEGDDVLTGTPGDDTIDAKGGNDTISGVSGNDTILGGAGNDILNGGVGADILSGGTGDDVLYIDADDTSVNGGAGSSDQVIVTGAAGVTLNVAAAEVEQAFGAGGNDTFNGASSTSALFMDGGAGDDVLIGGSANDTLAGGEGNDTLTGQAGNDILNGGVGADILSGGDGDDTLYVDSADTSVSGGAGFDVVNVAGTADFTLDVAAASIEVAIGGDGNDTFTGATATGNLSLDGGAGNDVLTGGSGNDVLAGDIGNDQLTGNAGNDILNGGMGADILSGGAGDDLLYIDADDTSVNGGAGSSDQVIVTGAAGVTLDVAIAEVELAFGAGGNDTFNGASGTSALFMDGGAGDDILTGGSANDTLAGGDGIDRITGGAGNDILNGGAGDDTYFFNLGDGIDTITEATGPGTGNTIVFGPGITAGDITLGLGSLLIRVGTGGDAIHLQNFDPANVLGGPHGIDTFKFADNTTLTYNQLIDRGFDVPGTGGDDILIGTSGTDRLTGGAGNDRIEARAGHDVLDGGTGADQLVGEQGDDTYVVDHIGDVVTENVNEGIDTVESGISYALGVNVENLTLTGTVAINGTGNGLNNVVTGNNVANVLAGAAGNDQLLGGAGNDTYLFNLGDGVDTVEDISSSTDGNRIRFGAGIAQSDLTLVQNGNILDIHVGSGGDLVRLLNFDPTGAAGSLVVATLEFANGSTVALSALLTPTPTEGDDVLTYGAGDDVIDALGGHDVVNAGAGNDQLNGGTGADQLIGGPGNDTYVVDNVGDVVTEQLNEGIDAVQSSISYTLGANVENLTLTGTAAINGTGNILDNSLTGNSANNTLTGGAGNDTLNGGAGADTLVGGTGNDTFVVDAAGDVVTELANEGSDSVHSSITHTLGANVENLTLTGTVAINGTGNARNNILTGNSAANVLTGGAGNDTYVVGASDSAVEAANAGIDTVHSTVTWTLGANLEALTLTGTAAINGTGNALNNILTGNSAANTLTGGAGNDVYVVSAGDTVVEAASGGTDTLFSDVTTMLSANVELLVLTGSNAINGTGNSLANGLTGTNEANVLNGGAGADTMAGLDGNDTYLVDNAGDLVVELANNGTDTVQSSVTQTLTANVEHLTLTGTSAINGTGNVLDNILTGNSAANVLTGGAGNDTYIVGAGDSVVENASAGTDMVQSSIAWTLGANLENLTLTGTGTINGTGNALNNMLSGNSANNVLTGLGGNDTYLFDRGGGQDTIVDNAGTADKMQFGATINPLDVVLSRQANDLRLAIHGSSDQITAQNWYVGTTNWTETIQAGNGQALLSTQVDQLIQAMASFSQQSGLTWDQAIDQQPQNVQTVLAASWQ